jgi:hypothetical protein
MNYKKGLIRLGIISLVVAPVSGYFLALDDIKYIRTSMAGYTQRVGMASADPDCVRTIKSGELYWNVGPAGIACNSLKSYWKDLEQYQGTPPNQGAIYRKMQSITFSMQMKEWMISTAKCFLYYVLFCIAVAGLIFTGRWVFKGLKSQ